MGLISDENASFSLRRKPMFWFFGSGDKPTRLIGPLGLAIGALAARIILMNRPI